MKANKIDELIDLYTKQVDEMRKRRQREIRNLIVMLNVSSPYYYLNQDVNLHKVICRIEKYDTEINSTSNIIFNLKLIKENKDE